MTIRPVPDKTAPRAERQAAMKELLPEGGMGTTYFVNGMKSGVYLTSITLRDGTRVEDPTDLLPAMAPPTSSPTGKRPKVG